MTSYIMYPTEVLLAVGGEASALLGLLIANSDDQGVVKITNKEIEDEIKFIPRKAQRNIRVLIENELISKYQGGYVIEGLETKKRQKCRNCMVENQKDLCMVEENPEDTNTTDVSQLYGRENDKSVASDKSVANVCSDKLYGREKKAQNSGSRPYNNKDEEENDKSVANVCSDETTKVSPKMRQKCRQATKVSPTYVTTPYGGYIDTPARSARKSVDNGGAFLESGKKHNPCQKTLLSDTKETTSCPQTLKPIIEHYYQIIGRQIPADHTKTLANVISNLRRLYLGTLYNDYQELAEYHDHPFTESDLNVCIRRHMRALSADFYPIHKKSLRIGLDRFLLNPYGKQEKPYFIRWLIEKPMHKELRMKDKNPKITKRFLTYFSNDVTDREYNKLVSSAERTAQYFKTAPVGKLSQEEMADIVIGSVEEYCGGNLKIHPGFFGSDQTFSKRIPQYLDEKGYIMASDTVHDRNKRIADYEVTEEDNKAFLEVAGIAPLLKFAEEREKKRRIVANAYNKKKDRRNTGEADSPGLDSVQKIQSGNQTTH